MKTYLNQINQLYARWFEKHLKETVYLAILRKIQQTFVSLLSVIVGLLFAMFITAFLLKAANSLLPQDAILMRVLCLSLLYIPPSFVFGRFLLRLLPVQRRIRNHYALPILQAILALIIVMFSMMGVGGESVEFLPIGKFNRYSFVEFTVFMVVQLLVLRKWYLFYRGDMVKPSVVFLRRFSGFAERGLLYTLIRAVPSGTTVLVLTNPSHPLQTWDPFLIGFAGFKIFRPIQSMPLYIESDYQNWPRVVTSSVESATLVVIDIAEDSEAMQAEREIINKYNAQHRSLALTTVGHNPQNTDQTMAQMGLSSNSSQIIHYSTEVSDSVVRYAIGYLLTFIVITGLSLGVYGSLKVSLPALQVLVKDYILISFGLLLAGSFAINHRVFGKPNLSAFSTNMISTTIWQMLNNPGKKPTNTLSNQPILVQNSQSGYFYRQEEIGNYIVGRSFWRIVQIERIKRCLFYILAIFVWSLLNVTHGDGRVVLGSLSFTYLDGMEHVAYPILLWLLITAGLALLKLIRLYFPRSKKEQLKQARMTKYIASQIALADLGAIRPDSEKMRINALCYGFIAQYSSNKQSVITFTALLGLSMTVFAFMDSGFRVALAISLLSLSILWLVVPPLLNRCYAVMIQRKLIKYEIGFIELVLIIKALSNDPAQTTLFEKILPLILSKHVNQLIFGVFDSLPYRWWRKVRCFFATLMITKANKEPCSAESILQGIVRIRRYFDRWQVIVALMCVALTIFLVAGREAISPMMAVLLALFFTTVVVGFVYLHKKKCVIQYKIAQSSITFAEYQALLDNLTSQKRLQKRQSAKRRQWVYEQFLNQYFVDEAPYILESKS